MTDYTQYEFKLFHGMPPEPGRAFGLDADGFPFVLNWREDEQCWYAIGFERDGELAQCVRCLDEYEDFITQWSWAPTAWSEIEEAVNG